MVARETVYKDDKSAKDTTAAKDTASATYFTNSEKAVKNAQKDCDDTAALITAKTAERDRLVNTRKVATHIYELTQDKFNALKAMRDDAKDL